MKLSELIRNLSRGELQNLALSNDGDGTIILNKRPQIIQYVNEGLLRLYSRFILKQKDVLIEMAGHITFYHLKTQFAESSGSSEAYPYIKDSVEEPFVEDVIRVLQVFDSLGCERPLNDQDNCLSVFTPMADTLQVPNPLDGKALNILYQARHAKLRDTPNVGETEADFLDQDIDLPFFLEGALTAFVGHKAFSHINGQENLLKSQEFAATYENICAEVENKDLVHQTSQSSHRKLEQRGFV